MRDAMTTLARRVRDRIVAGLLAAAIPVSRAPDLARLGSPEAGWTVPVEALGERAVCYCAGAGEDVSFDVELAKRGHEVHTFDPTPKSIAYVERLGPLPNGMRFHPYGVWSEDTTLKFYAPRDPRHVSHSVLNLQGTGTYFEAPCRSIRSIMRELGHTRVDLLKLDIEGAEYAVLEDLLRSDVRPQVIAVEFDQPVDPRRTLRLVRALRRAGYEAVLVRGFDVTFRRVSASAPR